MTTATSFTKEISYDRETRDFRATLDGNYIGHFDSYYEAEVALDQVAYDMLMDGQCTTHAACPDCEGAGCSTHTTARRHSTVHRSGAAPSTGRRLPGVRAQTRAAR
jgi:hypothetical protein